MQSEASPIVSEAGLTHSDLSLIRIFQDAEADVYLAKSFQPQNSASYESQVVTPCVMVNPNLLTNFETSSFELSLYF